MDAVDQGGLASLYQLHRSTLLRLVTARMGVREEAEDLLQDLWLKLRHQPPVEVAHARAYLFRMTQNLVTDTLRARQRRMSRERRWSDEATSFAPTSDDQIDHTMSAEQMLLDREEAETLATALATLPSGARRVFELHKVEGLKHVDVANTLGISRSGVEKHMAVAMKHLRHVLMDSGR